MRSLLLCTLALLVLFGIVSAGTVTLTGSCVNYKIGSSTIPFTLSNSGNDTAYNLLITPVVPHAQTAQSLYNISSLGPGSSSTLEVGISNISEKGMSAAYFSLAYQQGSSVFTAVFPCLIPIKNATTSQVFVNINESAVENGVADVRVNVFNAGADEETANVSLILPSTFTYRSSPSILLSLAPHKGSNVTFSLGFPAGYQASYSVAAVASYSKDNLSYTSLMTFLISSSGSSSESIFGSLLFDAAIALVALVLILILISLRKKRRKPRSS